MTVKDAHTELIEKIIMHKAYEAFVKIDYCQEHHLSNKEEVKSVKKLFASVIALLAIFILTMGYNLIEANMQKSLLQENFQKINQVMGIK